MARGTTLTNLLAMLNAELGNSTVTNTARDAEYMVLLSNKQKWFTTEYDWPFLERRWDVLSPANTQYVTFPTTDDAGVSTIPNFERMPQVDVHWNNVWQPVKYGISIDEYNALDYSLAQQSDPIQRWRASSNPNEPSNPNQFEVWPVPVTNQTVRFIGQRTVLPLAIGTDTADLDDMLLVLAVAAEKLTRAKQADAQMKLTEVMRRLQWTKQNYPTRDKRRLLGGGGDSDFKRQRRLVGITIAVH